MTVALEHYNVEMFTIRRQWYNMHLYPPGISIVTHAIRISRDIVIDVVTIKQIGQTQHDGVGRRRHPSWKQNFQKRNQVKGLFRSVFVVAGDEKYNDDPAPGRANRYGDGNRCRSLVVYCSAWSAIYIIIVGRCL